MRLTTVSVLVVAALASIPARADFDGNVNFFLGQKSLDSADWEPLDTQFEFGAVSTFGQTDWPVQIAADVLVSVDETNISGIDVTGVTFELDPGIRWLILKKGKVFPYIGGGIGLIGAAVDGEFAGVNVDDADAAFGFWGGGGVFFRLGQSFNIGFDLRYSTAEVDLEFGPGAVVQDVNAGGFSYGFLMGFGW